jgi:plastocyanin
MRASRVGLLVTGAFAVVCLVTEAFAGTHTIVQISRSFRPPEITIAAGDTLAFSNQDEFIHQIYVDSDQIAYDSAEQPPGETITIAFPKAGDFPIRCHIHPKMLLVVHVK